MKESSGKSSLAHGITQILVIKSSKSGTIFKWTCCHPTLLSSNSPSDHNLSQLLRAILSLVKTISHANWQEIQTITVSGLQTSLKATINAREHKTITVTVQMITVTQSLTLVSSKKHKMLSVGQLLTMMTTRQTTGALMPVIKTHTVPLNALPSSVQFGEILTLWTLLMICPLTQPQTTRW